VFITWHGNRERKRLPRVRDRTTADRALNRDETGSLGGAASVFVS
jgi:hypothetical protein